MQVVKRYTDKEYNELLEDTLNYFPYDEPNPQQLQIIRKCAQMIDRNILMINSSTGSGKTAAVLASLLARKTDKQRIVIFTRTISQMEPILREWARIVGGYENIKQEHSPKILPMLGKARLCKVLPRLRSSGFPDVGVNILCKATSCKLYPQKQYIKTKRPVHLLYKINYTLAAQGMNRTPSLKKVYEIYDKQHKCGYYEQQQILRDATIIVATYPYLSEPLFSKLLKHLGVPLKHVLYMIDEAHNLEKPTTLKISRVDIEFTMGILGKVSLLKYFIKLMDHPRRITAQDILEEEDWLNISHMIMNMSKEQRILRKTSLHELSRPEVINVLNFVQARHTGFMLVKKDMITLVQATPSRILEKFKESAFCILQSGTFDPIHVFKNLFNLPAEILETSSDMKSNKFGCFLKSPLTSKYTRRTPQMYNKMTQTIMKLYEISPRHVLLICPSYSYQEELLLYLRKYEEKQWLGELPIKDGAAVSRLVVETRQIDTEQIIKSLGIDDKRIIVGISNGKLSEGVEVVFNKQSLISMTIFAGLPFIPPSKDSLVLKKARNLASGNPAAVRQFEQNIPLSMMVQQAFGRSTRTQQDRGALIILDYRAERYLFKAIALRRYISYNSMYRDLERFYQDYADLSHLS
ncbi:MAG: DEAD/DEAH box helicase family protein [Candidatus Heimdallarchaeota archaeon]|nr:DEAD/DEAH box helicase family protein [Candidatus Heimdallarchaeota archaeon]